MTERNDIMAGFHVAEATSTVSLNIALADALSQYPELFRENVKIASFFGSMPLIWNGCIIPGPTRRIICITT